MNDQKTVAENGVTSCEHYCLKSLLPLDRCDFTKKLTPGVVFTRPGVGDKESTPKNETTMPGSGDEEPSTPKNETTISGGGDEEPTTPKNETRPGGGGEEPNTPKNETTLPGGGDEESITPKNETTIPEAPRELENLESREGGELNGKTRDPERSGMAKDDGDDSKDEYYDEDGKRKRAAED